MPAATNPHSFFAQAHGTPNWVDLQTIRLDRARVFYEAMFDWSFRHRFGLTAVPDDPAEYVDPSNALLVICDDVPVAEFVERSETFEDITPSSTWFPYIHVANLEAVLELVEPAGGLVLSTAADRDSTAKVATILDPNDALLCLWEPFDVSGNGALHGAGGLTWIELETPCLDDAIKFYGSLFGWDANELPCSAMDESGPYTMFTREAEPVAGAIETPMGGLAASWCPSFSVADVDASAIEATKNGGVVLAEPTNSPIGRQAVIVDPTGAEFAILGPKSNRPRPL